ncbi:MAG: DNA-deoxyinosine glycosylase [Betaproteobacteria bacterium]|nr:DNA-deoxyinosine glycosylase [Betaproteobacteria bacterium]
MPGLASLSAARYYAHPRNLFWPFMGEIAGAAPDLPYPARLERLRAANIALWDVLHSCTREGSLDTRIDAKSIRVNDFAAFFTEHPGIETICFNGRMAENCFRRHALPALLALPSWRERRLLRLPSTSPAHAGMSRAQKLEIWRKALVLEV